MIFQTDFRACDVHKFSKLNNLSINIFELKFYEEDNKIWKHKLIPLEISENKNADYAQSKIDPDQISDEIDLLIYKNHYALIKKLHVFFWGKVIVNMSVEDVYHHIVMKMFWIKHKFKCGQQEDN